MIGEIYVVMCRIYSRRCILMCSEPISNMFWRLSALILCM
jgi:hypothetical protein